MPAAPGLAQSEMMSGQTSPQPPTNLKAYFRYSYVIIQWNNVPGTAATEFRIFRLENYDPEKTLKNIATVPRTTATPPIVSYNDKTVQPGHKYTYFITSKDSFGNQSVNSAMLTWQAPPKFNY